VYALDRSLATCSCHKNREAWDDRKALGGLLTFKTTDLEQFEEYALDIKKHQNLLKVILFL